MSLKSHLLTRGKSTGFGVRAQKRRKIKAKVFSAYNLCTSSPEELTVQPSSTYVLGIVQEEPLIASLASVYSLAVA